MTGRCNLVGYQQPQASIVNRALECTCTHTRTIATGTKDVIRLWVSSYNRPLFHTSPPNLLLDLTPPIFYYLSTCDSFFLKTKHTNTRLVPELLPALPPSQWLTKPLPLSWTSMFLSPLLPATSLPVVIPRALPTLPTYIYYIASCRCICNISYYLTYMQHLLVMNTTS